MVVHLLPMLGAILFAGIFFSRSHFWVETSPIFRQSRYVTLWLFNIAMENGPFIDGLPMKNGDFPWLCWITRIHHIYAIHHIYKPICQLIWNQFRSGETKRCLFGVWTWINPPVQISVYMSPLPHLLRVPLLADSSTKYSGVMDCELSNILSLYYLILSYTTRLFNQNGIGETVNIPYVYIYIYISNGSSGVCKAIYDQFL